jgi:hypothetical protein
MKIFIAEKSYGKYVKLIGVDGDDMLSEAQLMTVKEHNEAVNEEYRLKENETWFVHRADYDFREPIVTEKEPSESELISDGITAYMGNADYTVLGNESAAAKWLVDNGYGKSVCVLEGSL